ncbi:MAG: adenosine kinase [Rickettsiales bacterium]|nr:adenosine kinase [Rickettsiales bacterium]
MTHFPLNTEHTRFDVTGVGNAIVDILSRVEENFITQHGMDKGGMALIDAQRAEALYAALGQCIECSGGSVANTVAALASLGARTAYMGRVYDDALGSIFRHDMRANGVTFDVPAASEGLPTARCFICVTPDAERTMNTFLGACTQFAPQDVHEETIAASAVLYLEGYLWDQPAAKEAIRKAMQAAKQAGRAVAFTLSDTFCVERHRAEFLEMIAENVDILFANEHEIRALAQQTDLAQASATIAPMLRLMVITRGAEGADVWLNGQLTHVDAAPVSQVVDLTGAGDLFACGFLYGLTQGWSMTESAQMGNRCAAEIIQQVGARSQQPLKRLVA